MGRRLASPRRRVLVAAMILSLLVAGLVTAAPAQADLEPVPTASAWADGERFVERGSWATHFVHTGSPNHLQVPLLADQDVRVGTVHMLRGAFLGCAATDVTVRYDITVPDVFLAEIHFVTATDLDGIPTTRQGNPRPGQFDKEPSGYSASFPLADGVVRHAFCVPDPDLDASTLVAAAHASVWTVPTS